MSIGATLQELFNHNDWANRLVCSTAVGLADEQCDQPFEMGEGTLRMTIQHIFGAERIWLQRWQGSGCDALPAAHGMARVADVVAAARNLANSRNAWLATLADADLDRSIAYRRNETEAHTNGLGDLMLHVCNHGVHHRAQAVNMLRRLGCKPPRADYIFMCIEKPAAAAPELSAALIRRYYAYGDWAMARVFALSADVDDARLDRPFEMGMGSLRGTLQHIADAEDWWLQSWREGPKHLFPSRTQGIGVREVRERFQRTAAERRAYLDGLADAGLKTVVSAQPVKDVFRSFPVGQTMLQLCGHGTHHRAQASNMLRHLGVAPPRLDYVQMIREAGA